MKDDAVVVIEMSPSGQGRVSINGQDISNVIAEVTVNMLAQKHTEVTLRLVPERVAVRGSVDALRAYITKEGDA